MEDKLLKRCELFDENNQVIFKKYWLEWPQISAVTSLLYTDADKKADVEKLKEMKEALKEQFGVFSNARGELQLPILASMDISDDPKGYITAVKDVYTRLCDKKFFKTEFDLLSAMIIKEANPENFDELVAKTQDIYKLMKEKHPMLTDNSDITTATMLALTGKDNQALIDEMEKCFAILKPSFTFGGEEVQTMSAILATSEMPAEEKCQRVIDIKQGLKDRGYSLTFVAAAPMIAGFAILDKPVDEICDTIVECAEYLKGKKGFGFLELGKEGRLTYGMMLALSNAGANSTLIKSSLTSIILMQIIITIVIIMTVTAAVNNNNK